MNDEERADLEYLRFVRMTVKELCGAETGESPVAAMMRIVTERDHYRAALEQIANSREHNGKTMANRTARAALGAK